METYYWESEKDGKDGMGEFTAGSDAEALELAKKIEQLTILYKEESTPSYKMVVLFDYCNILRH